MIAPTWSFYALFSWWFLSVPYVAAVMWYIAFSNELTDVRKQYPSEKGLLGWRVDSKLSNAAIKAYSRSRLGKLNLLLIVLSLIASITIAIRYDGKIPIPEWLLQLTG